MIFFINFTPSHLHIELRAFKVNNKDLLRYRIMINKTTADKWKNDGKWALYSYRLKKYLEIVGNEDFRYYGVLFEEREYEYAFTAIFIRSGVTPNEFPLPSSEKLKELGLGE